MILVNAIGRLAAVSGVALGAWLTRAHWLPAGAWLLDRWPAAVAIALVLGGCAAGFRRPARDPAGNRDEMRSLSTRGITLGALLLLFVAAVTGAVLMTTFGGGSPAVQLDAIRTAGTIVVGTGGAAALLLAARRQRATELTLAHQRITSEQSEHDAVERRITDLYTKAVEQLGSDKAPVRLGGLYALDRLGGNSEDQRETILNVICAYLRMPLPGEPKRVVESGSAEAHDKYEERTREVLQERQVRLTAQRILLRHRRPGGSEWWGATAIDLRGADLGGADLTGADLVGADLSDASLVGADLSGADLTGATLSRAAVAGASLEGAVLRGAALDRVDLSKMDLTGADLVAARLTGAVLADADLRKADLTRADLSGADLTGADLSFALLVEATLTGADLTGANLTSAVLTRTSLAGVTTTGTILVTELTGSQLDEITGPVAED